MTRPGVVLVAVVIVVSLAGMVAAGLLFRMTAAASTSAAMDNGEQAYQAAMSGVVRAGTVLQMGIADMDLWYDDPDLFKAQQVYQDGANTWYFSVVAPDTMDPGKIRYGLMDEAGKININTEELDPEVLRAIPELSDEQIDCLLDYLDEDDQPRRQGCEQEYYDRLDVPYVIANGPVATIEELLLIKGFDAETIYGEDVNLNGLLDANENDAENTFPIDDADGQLRLGLLALATTSSYEPMLTSEGEPKASVQAGPQELLAAGIPYETVVYLHVLANEGNNVEHPAELLNAGYRVRKDYKIWDGTQLNANEWIESEVAEEELPVVLDLLAGHSGSSGNVKKGLININTAPVNVLVTVPGIDKSIAESIVTVRSGLDGETKSTIGWLYTHGVLDEDKFKDIASFITARSYQYRVRSIGFGVPCGRIRVLDAVIDLAQGPPRITYLRDITRLGAGVSLDLESEEFGD